MHPPGVIGLTGRMTTPHRPSDPPPRRRSSWIWAPFIVAIAVLGFLAALPLITTVVVVALWGLGGSGSNK
jgi:hypothetical protein